jgi:hypothetical protein
LLHNVDVDKMVIRYTDGRAVEALLLSWTGDTLRVLAQGSPDVEEFKQLHGTWISETCEPARIQFASDRRQETVSEADCICSEEFTAQLIHLLLAGSEEAECIGNLAGMPRLSYDQMPV